MIYYIYICYLSILAFARGDPVKLLYPTDSAGNLCGTGQFAWVYVKLYFVYLKGMTAHEMLSNWINIINSVYKFKKYKK